MAVKPNEVYVLDMSQEQWAMCGEIEQAIDRKLLKVKGAKLFGEIGGLRPIIISLDGLGENMQDVTGTMWREIARRYVAQGWNVMPAKKDGRFFVLE